LKKLLCLFPLALLLFGCAAGTPSTSSTDTELQNTASLSHLSVNSSVSALPLLLAFGDGYKTQATIDAAAVGKQSALDALDAGEAPLALYEGSVETLPDGVTEQTVAYMAVKIIVNTDTGVDNLTSDQILSLFSGKITDWSEVGGNGSVTLILPNKNDAFLTLFEDLFKLRAQVDGRWQSLSPDTATRTDNVADQVFSTPGAIGIIPASSDVSGVNIISVDGVLPTAENIKDGSYTGAETITIAEAKDSSDEAKAFVDFCLSAQGQSLIASTGFMPK
jgi:ABC-type phosphate transport system, periplasmic component